MNKPTQLKTILVTGCSSGFGLLIAARLSSYGHTVFATMRDINKRTALLNEVSKRGGKVHVLSLDVTKKETIQSAVNEVLKNSGTIDVLINNAGYGIGGCFEDLTEEEIRQQMETNFFGLQNVTREVLPMMRSQKSGRIINISSVAGIHASPCFSAYNASKWALEAFSESLSYEVELFGIQVCMVEPGTYPTKIFYENARYAKNFSNPESPYYKISAFLHKRVYAFVNQCKKDPEKIAILVNKLIHNKNAPLRNFPDIEAYSFYILRKILPFSVYRWIIRKSLFSGLVLEDPTKAVD